MSTAKATVVKSFEKNKERADEDNKEKTMKEKKRKAEEEERRRAESPRCTARARAGLGSGDAVGTHLPAAVGCTYAREMRELARVKRSGVESGLRAAGGHRGCRAAPRRASRVA
eukprot:6978293-Prymnesium_polylepis.1